MVIWDRKSNNFANVSAIIVALVIDIVSLFAVVQHKTLVGTAALNVVKGVVFSRLNFDYGEATEQDAFQFVSDSHGGDIPPARGLAGGHAVNVFIDGGGFECVHLVVWVRRYSMHKSGLK